MIGPDAWARALGLARAGRREDPGGAARRLSTAQILVALDPAETHFAPLAGVLALVGRGGATLWQPDADNPRPPRLALPGAAGHLRALGYRSITLVDDRFDALYAAFEADCIAMGACPAAPAGEDPRLGKCFWSQGH